MEICSWGLGASLDRPNCHQVANRPGYANMFERQIQSVPMRV